MNPNDSRPAFPSLGTHLPLRDFICPGLHGFTYLSRKSSSIILVCSVIVEGAGEPLGSVFGGLIDDIILEISESLY